MSQDLRYHTLGLFLASAKIRKHRHHLVTGHGPHVFPLGNEYIFADLLVVRNDKSKILILLIISDHRPVRMLQNAQDTALCPFRALALCLDGNLHGITVHGVSRLILGYKDILVPPFHGHKTKSPRMAAEYSGYGADIRLAVLSFFRDTDLSLRQQCIQHFLQFFSLPLRHIQKNRHLLQLHRNVGRFFHQLQYHALSLCQLFLCHNFLVFCFFAAFYSALSLCPKDAGKNPVRRAFPIHYRSTFP